MSVKLLPVVSYFITRKVVENQDDSEGNVTSCVQDLFTVMTATGTGEKFNDYSNLKSALLRMGMINEISGKCRLLQTTRETTVEKVLLNLIAKFSPAPTNKRIVSMPVNRIIMYMLNYWSVFHLCHHHRCSLSVSKPTDSSS